MQTIYNYIFSWKPILSAAVIIGTWLCWGFLKRFIIHRIGLSENKDNLMRGVNVVFSIAKGVLILVMIIVILQMNGVNVSSMAAGLGVSTAIVGFALQDLLKDWIMGMSIVWENYYRVGDVIQLDQTVGRVTKMTLKTTEIKDIMTGNVVKLSNRNVGVVNVLSDFIDIVVPFSYTATFAETKELMNKITVGIRKVEGVKACEYVGTQEFADSYIGQLVRVFCEDIARKPQIRRDANDVILSEYEKSHLSIPFNQLDVHLSGETPATSEQR